MIYTLVPGDDPREYAVWLVTIILIAFGFRYAKEVLTVFLDKLYEVFILGNIIS